MAPISFFVQTLALLVTFVAGVPAPVPSPDPAQLGGESMGVPIANPDAKNIIANSYIVVYNNTFDDDAVAAHQAHWVATMAKRNIGKRSTLDNRFFSTKVNTFSIGTVRAMALDADDKSAIEINQASEVAYIEADTHIYLDTLVRQPNATTGLARLSAPNTGTTEYFFDDSAGQGITAFVVDTGMDWSLTRISVWVR